MNKKIVIPIIILGMGIGFFMGNFLIFKKQEQKIENSVPTWIDEEKLSSEEENMEKTEMSVLDAIVKEDNKVNIYLFFGDGCPHCEKELAYFLKIKEEYGELYNLYTFETWKNEENKKWFHTFASSMNDSAKGVPYTIIGEKTYIGFKESLEEEFINTIKSESKKNFDVYLDKIKN